MRKEDTRPDTMSETTTVPTEPFPEGWFEILDNRILLSEMYWIGELTEEEEAQLEGDEEHPDPQPIEHLLQAETPSQMVEHCDDIALAMERDAAAAIDLCEEEHEEFRYDKLETVERFLERYLLERRDIIGDPLGTGTPRLDLLAYSGARGMRAALAQILNRSNGRLEAKVTA